MTVFQSELEITTRGEGFMDVTAEVGRVVAASGIATGLCTVFVRHTSASLVIQENADPAVLRDLARWMAELAPVRRAWEHDDEGPDDMPSHARSALTRTSESIPVSGAASPSGPGRRSTSGSTAPGRSGGAWSCTSPENRRRAGRGVKPAAGSAAIWGEEDHVLCGS
jgi:secondary thiamine-phosphate synthase enzyme